MATEHQPTAATGVSPSPSDYYCWIRVKATHVSDERVGLTLPETKKQLSIPWSRSGHFDPAFIWTSFVPSDSKLHIRRPTPNIPETEGYLLVHQSYAETEKAAQKGDPEWDSPKWPRSSG